jgi:hypothetical protein
MTADWQQIFVTCVAAGALLVLLRPLLPAPFTRRRPGAGPACPSCAAGQAACARHPGTATGPRGRPLDGARER